MSRQRVKHSRDSVREFLDLEAEVEDSSDEEEYDTDGQGFIDDTTNQGENSTSTRQWQHDHWNQGSAPLDELFDQILLRATRSRCLAATEDSISSSSESVQDFALMAPRPGDYPLWKVSTRIGIEEIALASLTATARDEHELRSGFNRGSIRGAIYLECTMNSKLRDLLRKTPGILVHANAGIRAQMVDPSDHLPLLQMPSLGVTAAQNGQWIVVKKGVYKGDPGLVVQGDESGCEVLLIPRRRVQENEQKGKRKASRIIPPAALFEEYYCGLHKKALDWHSVSTLIQDMPYEHYMKFRSSKHPALDYGHMPRPREWSFKIGERVVIITENRRGTVLSTGDTYGLEVAKDLAPYEDLEPDEDTAFVPWQNLRKIFREGDFVQTVEGGESRRSGWVLAVTGDTCEVSSYGSHPELETWTMDVNRLEVSEAPWIRSSIRDPPGPSSGPTIELEESSADMTKHGSSGDLRRDPRHPWCGLEVLVIKKGALKQAQGKILDVWGDPSVEMKGTEIGLDIQFMAYNPATPFYKKRLMYSDVLEWSTHKELMAYRNPGPGFIRTSPPPVPREEIKATPSMSMIASPFQRVTLFPSTAAENGSETPRWTSTPADADGRVSPAWDPNSSLPVHCLLNPLLLELEIVGQVKGGDWPNGKQMGVWIVSSISGGVQLRGRRSRTEWVSLEPEWVTVKVPSAKLDNSLLVIIKGTHCGKFARRIRHLDNHAGPYALEVAVVTRVPGAGDKLTGEVLTLNLDHFGIIDQETREEKAAKNSLMKELRAPWKTR